MIYDYYEMEKGKTLIISIFSNQNLNGNESEGFTVQIVQLPENGVAKIIQCG